MALTLQYRPMTFDDIVDQKHIIDIIKAQVDENEMSSNYLFFGPRGTGKTTTARLIARVANCEDPQDNSPCNECDSCQAILDGQTLDFVEIDAASHTGVDNIRQEVLEKANYKPNQLNKKVYIIDEVHMLSKGAFNALLKIMEEPPEHLMFVLATTEINKVPETVISRSQVFNFQKLTIDDITDRLAKIADQEDIEYDKQGLRLIAKNSDGALRDSIKYLEQISILGKINVENVVKFMGVAPDKKIKQFIDYLREQNIDKIFEFLHNFQQTGIDLSNFSKQILIYINEHFLEDSEFYVQLADVFKNIYQDTKSYPFPIIVYKTHLYKFLKKKNPDLDINMEDVETMEQNNDKDEDENKEDQSDSENSKAESKSNDEGSKNDEKEKSNNKSNKEPQNDVNNENHTNSKSDNSNSTQSKNKQKASEKNGQDTENAWENDGSEHEQVLEKAISQIKEMSIKTALKKYIHIQNINEGSIDLVIINKIQYKLLSKEKKLKKLHDLFSNVLDKDVKVNLEYMSKQDFMDSQL